MDNSHQRTAIGAAFVSMIFCCGAIFGELGGILHSYVVLLGLIGIAGALVSLHQAYEAT